MAQSAEASQKLNIANYFIMSSPSGEVQDVVKDVVNLVDDPMLLTGDKLNAIMQQYNTDRLVSAPAPSGEEVIVSAYGQVDATHYLDPNTGKVLIFDHRKQAWTGETDQKQVLTPAMEEMRVAVNKELKTYVDTSYHKGKAVTAVYATDDGKITICISAKNSRLSNFWTGSIRAAYTVDVSNKGQADLSGFVKMDVHYFEDGNVQLHTDIKKSAKVQISDAAATAKSIVSTVDKIESEYHANLEELYVNMHSTTFKAMRRFWPINGQPMNWNAAAHQLATEISK